MKRIAYPGEAALWELARRERELGGGYFRQRPIGKKGYGSNSSSPVSQCKVGIFDWFSTFSLASLASCRWAY